MVLEVVMVAGVVALALPALALGVLGLTARSGHYSTDRGADRASLVALVSVRLVTLLLVFALSGLTMVAAVGALVRGLEMPSLVSVFFVLDLLLAVLVLLTFGRRDRRRARRRANPAGR